MDRRRILVWGRVFFALLTIVAIITQLIDLAGRGVLNPVSYFSYFTIDSNLIAIVVLLLGAYGWKGISPASASLIRGGAVVYMSVTGIVFTLLLSNTDVDTAIPWVNTVVHELMPLVIVADWLLDPPAVRLTFRRGLLWLGFPLVWIVYTLIRGALVGLYPYPFLDPANGGYPTVVVYCAGILVLMAIVCALAVGLGNAAAGNRTVPKPDTPG